VLEKIGATTEPVISEIITSEQLQTYPYNKISIISLHDLFLLASSVVENTILVQNTAKYMSNAPAIKPETKDKWILIVNDIMKADALKDDDE
jgi:hypothetical protein